MNAIQRIFACDRTPTTRGSTASSTLRRLLPLSLAILLSAHLPVVAAVKATGSPFRTQADLDNFARQSTVQFALIANGTSADGKPTEGKLHAQIRLTNQSTLALPAGTSDWQIYFHAIRKLQSVNSPGLTVEHVQGDLHRITANKQFTGLAPGKSVQIDVVGGPWIVSYSDWMPRAFMVSHQFNPAVFVNTDTEQLSDFVAPFAKPEQQLRHAKDLFPVTTTSSRYAHNLMVNQRDIDVASARDRILPTPKAVSYQKGRTEISQGWQIQFQGRLKSEANYLQQQLQNAGLGLTQTASVTAPTAKSIILLVAERAPDDEMPAEGYQLQILSDRIIITGADNAGVFYGVQSLLNLIPAGQANHYSLPQLVASDAPRYSWRGMHYDMARNFHGKAVTLQLIEQMARYKLNKLHLHLTEDEGWRLEIPGLPELTDIGATRCFDLTEQKCLLTQLGTGPHRTGSGNGYYSKADFVEILKFAAARHIEVIPEIDMPGHARAAVVAMEARYHRLKKVGQQQAAEQFLLSDPNDKSSYLTVQNYNDNSVNVCLDSSYAFIDKVVYELQQMYRQASLQLSTYHMGGDEVGVGSWQQSPACQALLAKGLPGLSGISDLKPYFVGRVAALLQKRRLALGGWEDGLMYDANSPFNRSEFANDRVYANVWDNIWEWGVADRAYRLANAGYQVVLSHGTHLYLDHPNEVAAEERGYYWASRFTDAQKIFGYMPDHLYANADKTLAGEAITNLETLLGRALPKLEQPQNILGMQGQVWSETIRTAEQLEQMVYPRLLPIAERAWHQASWEGDVVDQKRRDADYQAFAQTMTLKELPKLAQAGVSFYLPPPGALIKDGLLTANSAYPGLPIEYSLDQGKSWVRYTEATQINSQGIHQGKVLLRTTLPATADKPARHSRIVYSD
jgi:hexosaminidase